MSHNIPADTVTAQLIVVRQLPVIEERLFSQKAECKEQEKEEEP